MLVQALRFIHPMEKWMVYTDRLPDGKSGFPRGSRQ